MKRNPLTIMIFAVVLFLFAISISQCKINKDKVVIAINCGGPSFVDSDGIHYEKDNYFDAGVSSDYGLNYDISGTNNMEVYQTERWHSETFTYSVPVRQKGKYVLVLKFSEVYFSSIGEKVFDIAIGKKLVFKDMDIFAKVGKAAAHDEFVEFEIKDDKLFINNVEVQGGYDANSKTIKIRFIKGKRDNPKINAIMILQGDINDTDFAEKKKHQEEQNRKRMQELKKKYLIELKHDPDQPYDEDAALSEDNDDLLTKEEPSILQIFTTQNGALILISFLLFLGINYALDLYDTKPRTKKVKSE